MSQQWNLDGRYSLFAAVGFCGSLTTMSAFALDSSNLLESNHYGALGINIVANIGLSITALIGGKSLMSAIISLVVILPNTFLFNSSNNRNWNSRYKFNFICKEFTKVT